MRTERTGRNQMKYFDRKTKLQTKGCGNDRGRNPNTEIGDLNKLIQSGENKLNGWANWK